MERLQLKNPASPKNPRSAFLRLTAAIVSIALIFLFTPVHADEVAAPSQPETTPVAKPHDELDCNECHKSHSIVPPNQDSRSCIKCHEDQTGENSHPTGVVFEGEPPEGIPLSKDGKLTCNTCHILHETKDPERSLLRREFNDLCASCHFPEGKKKEEPAHSE
jgi:predicted CXXCH cytochrome family protein